MGKHEPGKVRTSINSVFVTLWWKCFAGVVLNRSERVKQKSKTSSSYICLFLSLSELTELWANYLTNLCTGVQERKREKRRKKRKVQGLWSCRCLFYSCFLLNKRWLCKHLLKRLCDQNYIRRWQRFHTFYRKSNYIEHLINEKNIPNWIQSKLSSNLLHLRAPEIAWKGLRNLSTEFPLQTSSPHYRLPKKHDFVAKTSLHLTF